MTRTWWENEEIVEQFRRWLSETAQEAAYPPANFAVDKDEDGGDDEPDEVLHFPAETIESSAASNSSVSPDSPASFDESLSPIGLLEVVESLTAMRHELKLQTKSSRGLESAVEQARQGLDVAIREFQTVRAREQEAADRAVAPLVEALAGFHEALLRGAKAFRSGQQQITLSLTRRINETLDEQDQRLPAWRRFLSAAWLRETKRRCAEEASAAGAAEFARLLEGYELILQRLERDLARHGVRRIDTVGRRVDPRLMTVVELVDDPQQDPETVVEELRPGYLHGDAPIRFAEVRAVGARRTSEAATAEQEDAQGRRDTPISSVVEDDAE